MPKPARKIWLGIDVGTSGLKALAVDESGQAAASALVEYGMQTPRPGWAEQDPAQWWASLKKAIRLLQQKIPRLDDSLAGIGLTGQMHSSVFLDQNFQVIRPAILWCDQRPAQECAELTEKIGFDRLVSLTLNRALTGFTLPKLLWLKNREPKNYTPAPALAGVQRLHPIQTDRRACHRGLGRFRHAHVRCAGTENGAEN